MFQNDDITGLTAPSASYQAAVEGRNATNSSSGSFVPRGQFCWSFAFITPVNFAKILKTFVSALLDFFWAYYKAVILQHTLDIFSSYTIILACFQAMAWKKPVMSPTSPKAPSWVPCSPTSTRRPLRPNRPSCDPSFLSWTLTLRTVPLWVNLRLWCSCPVFRFF